MEGRVPPDATTADQIDALDAKTARSATRQVLRAIMGSALLAVEHAGAALQGIADTQLPNRPPTAAPLPPRSARHVLIGALAVGPAWVNQQMTRLARRGRGALAGGVRRASGPLRFAARFLPTDEIRRWSSVVQSRAAAIALGLAEVGRREEPIARRLAGAAVTSGVTGIFDRIAGSPQLRSLVREQSAGMGRLALDDLRAQSARADGFAESLVGHLLPHRRRKPSDGSGSP
jgi:hypothetical protein